MNYCRNLFFVVVCNLAVLSPSAVAEDPLANKSPSRATPVVSISPDHRAVTVEVFSRDVEWAKPNSMVDVVRIEGAASEQKAKVIAEKVRVLSVSRVAGKTTRVTLLVTKTDALAVLSADSIDPVRLMLRGAE